MEHAKVALRLAPNDAHSYFCIGQSQTGLKQYADAVKSFTRAVELAPEIAHYWAALAMVRHRLGQKADIESSVLAYTQAIRLNPNKAFYFQRRGALQLKLGLVREAIADLNEALALHPDEITRTLISSSLKKANRLLAEAAK